MGKKFIFVEDLDRVLKQGKTEIVLPEGTRFSPAASDLMHEKGIQVSFTGAATTQKPDARDAKRTQSDTAKKIESSGQGLIAVAAGGRDINGPVGKDVSKEPFFLIFDVAGRFIDVIKNPYANDGDYVAPLIANLMASSQVSAIVAENFASNLRTHLEAKKVQYYEISGRIQEVVKTVMHRRD